jgi:integrase
MHTGLRGADVVNLTYDSIDWERDELRIMQSKTKNPLELHLEPVVGNAIADYLLQARPTPAYESSFLFLSTKPPFNKLQGVGSINDFLYNYMDKAEVSHRSGERKGFHSFRRALATDLLEAGVETVVISNILGQVNLNSVRSYLSLSQSKLKECALSLDGFALAREELL